MRRNPGNILIVTISLLAILAIGTVGFLHWENSNQTKTPQGWATYTNQVYHYSFKYPDNVLLVTELDKNTCPPHTLGCLSVSKKGELVNIYDESNNQYFFTINMNPSIQSADLPYSKNVPNEVKPLLINGAQAYLLVYNQSTYKSFDVVSNYSIKGTKIYSTFRLDHQNSQVAISGENLPASFFETIPSVLNTLEFLDQNLEGTFCGGFAGVKCLDGFVCRLDGKYPDAGGKCTKQGYTCPANGWVDCMPVINGNKTKDCAQEAISWYKTNCPNFQGVAQ